MLAANESDADKNVILPKGTVITAMPMSFSHIKGVRLTIEGNIHAS